MNHLVREHRLWYTVGEGVTLFYALQHKRKCCLLWETPIFCPITSRFSQPRSDLTFHLKSVPIIWSYQISNALNSDLMHAIWNSDCTVNLFELILGFSNSPWFDSHLWMYEIPKRTTKKWPYLRPFSFVQKFFGLNWSWKHFKGTLWSKSSK